MAELSYAAHLQRAEGAVILCHQDYITSILAAYPGVLEALDDIIDIASTAGSIDAKTIEGILRERLSIP